MYYLLSLYRDKKLEETYFDKEAEKAFLKASGAVYEKKVYPRNVTGSREWETCILHHCMEEFYHC